MTQEGTKTSDQANFEGYLSHCDQSFENKFIDILKNADFNSHPSPLLRNNLSEPKVIEVIAYLKLLKAFKVLKNRVLAGSRDENGYNEATSLKTWQMYLTNSVRRFIIFINSLYSKIKEEPNVNLRYTKFYSLMDALIPQLDVILIWNSVILNNSFFNDVMKRNNFTEFLSYPFPWSTINESIHNYSFEFLPNSTLKQNYTKLINGGRYELDSFHLDFVSFDQVVNIYCPNCCCLLVENVELSNNMNTGFADNGFETNINPSNSECICSDLTEINHNDLRKLQLIKDCFDSKPLMGFLEFDLDDSLNMNALKEALKTYTLNNPAYTMINVYRNAFENIQNPISQTIFAKNYVFLNLIHCTIPKSELQIPEDLVASTIRQEQFMNDMLKISLLHDANIVEIIKDARVRYTNFISLENQFRDILLYPTLEIDLILKTSQLSRPDAMKSFYQKTNLVFIQEDDLEVSFMEMLTKYSKNYEDYETTCGCRQCQSRKKGHRKSVYNIWKNKFGSSRRRSSGDGSITLTHPSLNYCWFSSNNSPIEYNDMFIKKQMMYLGVYVNSPFISPVNIINA